MPEKPRLIQLCLLLGVCMIAGTACSRSSSSSAPPPAKTEKSSTQTLIDGFTGKTAVEAKKSAEATLNDVNAARNEDMAEMNKLLGHEE